MKIFTIAMIVPYQMKGHGAIGNKRSARLA